MSTVEVEIIIIYTGDIEEMKTIVGKEKSQHKGYRLRTIDQNGVERVEKFMIEFLPSNGTVIPSL